MVLKRSMESGRWSGGHCKAVLGIEARPKRHGTHENSGGECSSDNLKVLRQEDLEVWRQRTASALIFEVVNCRRDSYVTHSCIL